MTYGRGSWDVFFRWNFDKHFNSRQNGQLEQENIESIPILEHQH